MQIILNDEQSPSKYYLLKQSLNDSLSFRINKNLSYSQQKNNKQYRNGYHKKIQEEISQWKTQSQNNTNDKKITNNKFYLPDVSKKSKSHNLQQLTRELLKYEQFDIQNMDQNNKFRLTLLRQMTKISFKKQKTKSIVSPKTINLKLKFPDYYQNIKKQNQDINQYINSSQGQQNIKKSLQAQRSSRGLIPSIKKHIGTSFMKKSIFRSESQHDPYLPKKINLLRSQFSSTKRNIMDEMKLKFDDKFTQDISNKVKITKVEKKLPVNFLSYCNRKNKSLNKLQQSYQKKKNIISGNNRYLRSFYPNQQNQRQEPFQKSKIQRLSQCLLLNNKIFPHNIHY